MKTPLLLIVVMLLLVGCSSNESPDITGSAVADVEEELEVLSVESESVVEQAEEENDQELLAKKQELLTMIQSGSYDKIEVSLLLNEINDIDMITAWNALQRCINCNEFSTLKRNFIEAIEESLE